MLLRIIRRLAAVFALMLLCSCNAVALSGTESLLEAPKLNKRQAEVSQALESSLSLRSIVYKYPQSGDYRSPFVFYDLDGDGLEEAIVFYSSANDESGALRAKILTQRQDGAWSPFHDISSLSTQVEFVQFVTLLKDRAPCMLIGWRGEERRTSTLGVYSIKNGEFIVEADLSYMNYAVGDFDTDGLFEIVVVTPDSGSRYMVSLIRDQGGYIGSAGELLLSEDVQSVRSLVTGRLDFAPRSTAIYIDESLSDGASPTIATEILKADAAGLSLLVGGEPVTAESQENASRINYELTFRGGNIYCADFDGDGVVELPYPLLLTQDPLASENLPAVQLWHLLPEGFETQKTAVLNVRDGYLFYYPERWVPEEISAERDRDAAELRFRKYNSDTESPEEELLRIRMSSTRNNPDMFEQDSGYSELYSRGTTLYSAHIPALSDEPMLLTKDEVGELFLPLVP